MSDPKATCRILFISAERFVFQSVNPLDLAELCAADGHEVFVASPFAPEALEWNQGRGFQCVPLPRTSGRAVNFAFWREAVATARRLRPDVIIGVNAVGFVAADLARIAGYTRRLIYYSLELAVVEEAPRSVSTRWQARRAKSADLVVTTGPHRGREMSKRFHLPETPVSVANAPLRSPAGSSTELRDRLKAAGIQARFVLSYTGAAGRHNCLPQAAEASRLWRSDAVLAIHGFGGSAQDRAQLERAVVSSNGRSVLLPPVPGGRDALLQYIAGADAGLVLYDHRGDGTLNMVWYTPNKVLDYLACGLPVVASDNPSLLEEVQQAGIGACCDPRDPKSIAEAVDRVFENHAVMAARSRELFDSTLNYVAQSEPVRQRLREWASAPPQA